VVEKRHVEHFVRAWLREYFGRARRRRETGGCQLQMPSFSEEDRTVKHAARGSWKYSRWHLGDDMETLR
jgi:hypothetical protein